jgi:AAA domain, putative AbiEii toxin, Type IV TA system/AAA domain
MYISSVTMSDFRCYRRAEAIFVHLDSPDDLPQGALKNVTLLVGVNGSGKTTVLRAVALATLGPIIHESGYHSYYQVRRPKAGSRSVQAGIVSVHGVLDSQESAKLGPLSQAHSAPDTLAVHVEIIRRNDYEFLPPFQLLLNPGMKDRGELISELKPGGHYGPDPSLNNPFERSSFIWAPLDEYSKDFSPSFFMVGYGANRRVEYPDRSSLGSDSKLRGRRYLRVAGLFEEGVTLIPLAAWLPQLNKTERFDEIVRLLNKTLPTGTRFAGKFHPDQQPLFLQQGVELPFPALSDGYRSYIGLIGDILSHLNDCCPKELKLTEQKGVVMVDDIDLHLHPQWQRVVVPRLAKAFPKLQFILTTHSPLVAGTVHAANVRVIGKNKILKFSERLHGLSVDQILSSRYFGHTPPRSEDAEDQLQKLLEGPIDEGNADPALAFLKELAGQDPTSR